MIEIYLLEHLDAFARLGTLSAASEELHISQPALTRSMQKLEQELGVTLFVREKNRMHLNDNGKLAAEYAARLLSEDKDMVRIIQAYDRSHRTIFLGSCAPTPIYPITSLLQQLYPEMTISILRRRKTGKLDTAEGLGMPFAANRLELIKYLNGKDDNLNPILREIFADGFDFYGVKEIHPNELININHYSEYESIL